jgi:putative colanic acid biosynthesis acetyltransferase WcaF
MAILRENDPYTQPSFSLSNRLLRVAWGIVYALLFRTSPRPLHRWRAFLLRCFGAKMGRHCHVYPKAVIWAPWNLALADYVGIADDVQCYSIAAISIGERTVISQGTFLCTGTHNYEDPNFQLMAEPITIGAQVWLCAESFVHPGVTIADGTVVGARSVVTRDLPAWMVCTGNPCRPVKPRILQQSPSP